MKISQIRKLALALPEASEQPHFDLASFRVAGKIFATLPPDGEFLHVFVDDTQREVITAVDPKTYEPLWWGKKIAGLRVNVATAKVKDVAELLRLAWERKAPKKLLAKLG